MLRWGCLVLYVLVICSVSAVPVALRNHQSTIARGDDRCSSYTVIIASETNTPFHVPDDCLGYEVDDSQEVVCDSKGFPMTCTFKLKKSVNSAFISNFLSETSKNETAFVSSQSGRPRSEAEMETFASKAVLKALLVAGNPCKPPTVGKPPMRHMDCHLCWSWGIPHPCRCDCRGWNQVGTLCSEPCHVRGAYTFDSGAYCHIPCDGDGLVAGSVGCGLGHDRVCVADGGACVQRFAQRIVDFAEFLTNVLPGAGPAMRTAARAGRAVASQGKRAVMRAVKNSLVKQAKDAAMKAANMKFVKDAFKSYGKGAMDRILEEGAIKVMAANLPNSDTDFALEIAKLADPTGVVTLVAGWVPPDACQMCTLDNC